MGFEGGSRRGELMARVRFVGSCVAAVAQQGAESGKGVNAETVTPRRGCPRGVRPVSFDRHGQRT